MIEKTIDRQINAEMNHAFSYLSPNILIHGLDWSSVVKDTLQAVWGLRCSFHPC